LKLEAEKLRIAYAFRFLWWEVSCCGYLSIKVPLGVRRIGI